MFCLLSSYVANAGEWTSSDLQETYDYEESFLECLLTVAREAKNRNISLIIEIDDLPEHGDLILKASEKLSQENIDIQFDLPHCTQCKSTEQLKEALKNSNLQEKN
jgi:hydroxypyruvate isomerase